MKKNLFLLLFLISAMVLLIILNFNLNPKTNFKPLIQIEEKNHQSSQSIPDQKITIILAGDVMLGRTVMIKSLSMNDNVYPFRKIAERLNSADIIFLNLENTIIENCPEFETGFKFCTLPRVGEGLVFSGVDVVTVANNHSSNFGQEGLDETVSYLNDRGISATGLGKLVIKEIDGTRFGFLGFDFLSSCPKEDDYKLIRESKSKVDTLIVGVHWGTEYTSMPSDTQKKWAMEMIKNGADIISGHHPHWVQSFEEIDGKSVYYSLGNLIFDQMWSEETKKSIVVELIFENNELKDQNIYNTYMSSWAQPEFVE